MVIKLHTLALSFSLLLASGTLFSRERSVYYEELKAFKKSEEAKMFFNKHTYYPFAEFYSDLDKYEKMPRLQLLVARYVLGSNCMLISEHNMPRLYAYVEQVCKQHEIVMPAVFVVRHKTLTNAAATKFFRIPGCILVGQRLLRDFSDEAIEAIVAHELGHIKYNHTNKKFLIFATGWVLFAGIWSVGAFDKVRDIICKAIELSPEQEHYMNTLPYADKLYQCIKDKLLGIINGDYKWIAFGAALTSAFAINKKFEKEADEFSYKTVGKGEGLIEFFEWMHDKNTVQIDKDLAAISDLLAHNKDNLKKKKMYAFALIDYYLTKYEYWHMRLWNYLYYNTFWGAHPSDEARIAAVRKYLAGQEA